MFRKILVYVIVLLGGLSCSERLEEDFPGGVVGDKVIVDVSLHIPHIPVETSSTRALGEKPALENLYLAVFDASGYLLEYVKADAQLAAENETGYNYTVALTPTDFPTTIHFIGNAPVSASFGSETEVLGSMYTSGGEAAYWQRVHLPDGIRTYAGVLDASVRNRLTGIRLIRNFAWIQLDIAASVDNFQLESYCVLNTRTRGSVAPYNSKTKEFIEYGENVRHDDLIASGYEVFIPEGSELITEIPEESRWYAHTPGQMNAYFVYEREYPRSTPSCILMKGTYDPNPSVAGDEMPSRYYKVDLRDNSGKYFPILRNFRYRVEVGEILHEGHSTAQKAMLGAGSSDISTSMETEDFSNISNNIARIFVSYTDTTLVTTDDFNLKYKFIFFGPDGDAVINDNVQISLEDPEGGNVVKAYSRQVSDDASGWRTITITPDELTSISKKQTMVLVGTVTVDEGTPNEKTYSLQRRVSFSLHEKMDLPLECDPDAIAKGVGKTFDLILRVPGGLGDAMFPLDFELEAEQQSITPDMGDDLPVVTGGSIVPGKESKTTIGFLKSVSWEEYENAASEAGHRIVHCHFKSSKAESATRIYARNKYFNLAHTELANYVPAAFSDLTFNMYSVPFGVGQELEFSFNMSRLPEQGYVTITLGGLEPAPSETRLTYLGVVDGKAQYSFNPSSLGNTLKLATIYEAGDVDVSLSAYRFEDASASLSFSYATFHDMVFDPARVPGVVGAPVSFSFNMSRLPEHVVVTLNELVPAAGETRLELISGNRYSFRPVSISNTLQLVTTTAMDGDVVRVKLEALGFNVGSAAADRVLLIPSGNIRVGGYNDISNNSNVTFSLYTSNPGDAYAPSGLIGSFQTRRNGSNPSAIEISKAHYEAIKANGGNVYIRFYTTYIFWTTYYVAVAPLDDLMDGGVTLNFTEV